jgi:hypothetical protein
VITVGRIREARGEVAAAWASLAEALTLAWAKGPRLFVATAIEEMGVQTVRQGHAPHGVPLLAAAALRHALGTPVRPADRPAIDGALAVGRGTGRRHLCRGLGRWGKAAAGAGRRASIGWPGW